MGKSIEGLLMSLHPQSTAAVSMSKIAKPQMLMFIPVMATVDYWVTTREKTSRGEEAVKMMIAQVSIFVCLCVCACV